jgi:hypothetical protein
MTVDFFVDGAAIGSFTVPSKQGNPIVNVTQKWQATAGTHTISARALNASGTTSEITSLMITVVPSTAQSMLPSPAVPSPVASATLIPPTAAPVPRTATPSPTATTPPTRVPTPTLIPMSANITFKFDDGVTSEQREAAQKGITLAQQYFGDAGPIKVYAYTSLDALMDESNQYYKRTADSNASKNIKQHMQNGAWIAYAEGDALWAWISKSKIWQPANIQYAQQLMAHEYFHIVQNYTSKKTGDDQAPLWLREASAEYGSYVVIANAGLVDLNRLTKAKIERTRGILNPLSTMETLKGAEVEDTETPYSLGFVAARFIAANYGEPALLRKYWQVRATSATWQDAFQSAFGVSVDDFYRTFEEYRRTALPPYCGTVGEPAATTLTVKFDRQFPPGTLNFQDFIYSVWSPDATGYTFCIKGYPLATTSWDFASKVLKYPTDKAKLDSCGGSCWIVYMNPNSPAGPYTFAVELPDGRRAEATFQHAPNPAPATPHP